MANQEHLDILKQGVDIWNKWREAHPDIRPNFNRANLRKIDLDPILIFEPTHKSINVNLSYASLNGTDFGHASLLSADFSYSDLDGAYFGDANISTANFSHANLRNANLIKSIGISTNFSYSKLNNAAFNNALLYMVDLSYADLSRAELTQAHFLFTKLYRADLSHAIVGLTTFGDVDLREVTGLETVIHNGPSPIGTNTIMLSRGTLSEGFVRKAGVVESLITYARSLSNTPIDYYTCFISYSSKDESFAKRLYADLQSNNVRCWFAPEDLKIGEKFWHRIDESIRLYDKLLIVLSQHSIDSEWVEREVVAALEKEHHQKMPVLFPITLDEAFKHTFAPWAADIRRSRHIGDFSSWKNHDEYGKAFKSLLRDLKAET